MIKHYLSLPAFRAWPSSLTCRLRYSTAYCTVQEYDYDTARD